MNIPLRDPSNIPDPYVKLYLLPARNKESKRKTVVVKDNCNPVYDATFEYLISTAELLQSELEVTVCTQKGFLSGGSPIIGMVNMQWQMSAKSGLKLRSQLDNRLQQAQYLPELRTLQIYWLRYKKVVYCPPPLILT